MKPSRLEALLEKVHFSDADWLFILGDVVDRQNDGGVELLQWLLYQPNVQLILGNHEAMLLACSFAFEIRSDEEVEQALSSFAALAEKKQLLETYRANGGDVTLAALRTLGYADRETLFEIFDYLRDCPLYETVSAGGRDFVLVHGGFENFSPEKKLSQYAPDELFWYNTSASDVYFNNAVTVLGHTPTFSYGAEHQGKILRTPTWINIDVGIPYGNPPALLRLDDLAEFYE